MHQSLGTAVGLGVGLAWAGLVTAAGQRPNPAAGVANAELFVLPVQGNVYMLAGPGGNITIQVGKDGALLVDTMFEPATKITKKRVILRDLRDLRELCGSSQSIRQSVLSSNALCCEPFASVRSMVQL